MIPGERWMDFKSVSLPHPLLEVAGGHREYQLTFSESYSRGAVKTVSDTGTKNVSEYFRNVFRRFYLSSDHFILRNLAKM